MNKRKTYINDLHIAIENGDEDLVSQLVNNGFDVELRDSLDRFPLTIAIETGNKKIVEILLNAGAYPEWGSSLTPLEDAMFFGHNEIFSLLIDAGANPHRIISDDPLLHQAVMGRKYKILEKLLSSEKTDIDISNKLGETALMIACQRDCIKSVGILLKYGAAKDIRSNLGKMAIDFAKDEIINFLSHEVA